MAVETSSWDPMLVVLVKRKLPFKTREEWEKQLEPEKVPTYTELRTFLEKRFRTLESLELVGGTSSQTGNKSKADSYNNSKINSSERSYCPVCKDTFHSIMKCETFLSMSVGNRSAFVIAKSLCRNCLATGHTIKDCKSKKTCFKCNRSHNTLLHRDDFSKDSFKEQNFSKNSFVTRGQSCQNVNMKHNPNPFNSNHQSHYNPKGDQNVKTHSYTWKSGSQAQVPDAQQKHQRDQTHLNVAAQNFHPRSSSQSQASPQIKMNFTTIGEDIFFV